MWSYGSRMGPSSNMTVRSCEDTKEEYHAAGYWSDVAANQGALMINSHQKLGRCKGGLYPVTQREHGSADNLKTFQTSSPPQR